MAVALPELAKAASDNVRPLDDTAEPSVLGVFVATKSCMDGSRPRLLTRGIVLSANLGSRHAVWLANASRRNLCILPHSRVPAALTLPGVGAWPPHLQARFQRPGEHWVIILLEDDRRRV